MDSLLKDKTERGFVILDREILDEEALEDESSPVSFELSEESIVQKSFQDPFEEVKYDPGRSTRGSFSQDDI